MKQKVLFIEWFSLMLTGGTLIEKAVEFNRETTDGESQEVNCAELSPGVNEITILL